MLSFDRLTVKAGEALQAAATEARKRGNAEIHGVHLLSALLDQQEGIVVPVLQKLGLAVPLIRQRTEEAIGKLARVEGGSEARLSRDLTRAMDVADEEARAERVRMIGEERDGEQADRNRTHEEPGAIAQNRRGPLGRSQLGASKQQPRHLQIAGEDRHRADREARERGGGTGLDHHVSERRSREHDARSRPRPRPMQQEGLAVGAGEKAEKDGDMSQDDSRSNSEKVQKMTDETISEIDRLLHDKEKEIMQV